MSYFKFQQSHIRLIFYKNVYKRLKKSKIYFLNEKGLFKSLFCKTNYIHLSNYSHSVVTLIISCLISDIYYLPIASV